MPSWSGEKRLQNGSKYEFGTVLGSIWEGFGTVWALFWVLLGAFCPFFWSSKLNLFQAWVQDELKRPFGWILGRFGKILGRFWERFGGPKSMIFASFSRKNGSKK